MFGELAGLPNIVAIKESSEEYPNYFLWSFVNRVGQDLLCGTTMGDT